MGDGDLTAFRAELELLRRIEPRAAAEHAAGLAWLGDLESAAPLAALLRPRSALARAYEALVILARCRMRQGDRDGARAALARVASERAGGDADDRVLAEAQALEHVLSAERG